MSEAPVPRPERPGVVRVVLTALLVCYFAVKAARWWLAVSAGTTAVGDMTTWGWVKIVFYHVAVVAGIVGIVEMLRARARAAGAEPDAAADPAGGHVARPDGGI